MIRICFIIIPLYANKVNCAILLVKSKGKGWDSLHYLAFEPTVQVLSTSWADSTVVLSAKVNCRPWVTVLFAQGNSVFKNRFSLGIHVHTPTTHSRLIYFKHVHEETNMESKTNKVLHTVTLKQKFALFGSYILA